MDKWVVEGYITKDKKVFAQFNTSEEANKEAKLLADTYHGCRFNVTGPNDIKGLTDHHYQYDDYFKMSVEFCHND